MYRSLGRASLLAVLAAAASASPAPAQSRCQAPEDPGSWHSCLSASHNVTEDGVHLSKARARLVVRHEDGCPQGADRRRVVIRTAGGRRLGKTTVRSSCRRGVARWNGTLELDVDLREGTVVRSLWSGIPDSRTAPRVKLGG